MKAQYRGINPQGIKTAGIRPQEIKADNINYRREKQTVTSLLRHYRAGADDAAVVDGLQRLVAQGDGAALNFMLDAIFPKTAHNYPDFSDP